MATKILVWGLDWDPPPVLRGSAVWFSGLGEKPFPDASKSDFSGLEV